MPASRYNFILTFLRKKIHNFLTAALFLLPLFNSAQNKLNFTDYGPFGSSVFYSLPDAARSSAFAFKLHLKGPVPEKDFQKTSQLNTLQALMLEENYLDTLPEAFSGFPALMYLSSRKNPLNNIPKYISGNQSLVELEISGSSIDSLHLSDLQLARLRYLTIHKNDQQLVLSDSLAAFLPPALEELVIFESNLTAFPPSACRFKRLKKLNLSGNQLHNLPQEIGYLRNLEWLILDNNKLTQLPGSIESLRKITYLSAQNNLLETIPDNISNMTNLGLLDLRGNPISEYQIDILRVLLPGCEIRYDPVFKKAE